MKTLDLPHTHKIALLGDSTHIVFAKNNGYVSYRVGRHFGSNPLMGKTHDQVISDLLEMLTEKLSPVTFTHEII